MREKAIVGLADAVKALRSELIEAVTEGQGEWMRFSLDRSASAPILAYAER